MSWALDIGIANVAKSGEELCGDVVEIKNNADSTIVVLSDGLGSGVKANILANLTVKIAANMLAKGVDLPEVVETMVQTLPVCQLRQIAYSTFTILQVFEDRKTYLAQFDNPPAVLIRDGSVIPLTGSAKTIAGRLINERTLCLGEDDTLVLVSDGVTHAGINGLLPLGLGIEGLIHILKKEDPTKDSAQDLAEKLLEICEAYSCTAPGDDITIVVLKVRQPVKGVVLSGPPLSREDDSRLVEEFFSGTRRRAICGGTTANIVARERHLPLSVGIKYADYSLPPTASMPGIDLVTEGILTLTRVVQLLEEGKTLYRQKSDGASLLLKWLMECDEIELLVGLRVNPAHLIPQLPFSLGQRSSILQRLSHLLCARGKKVIIKWF